MSQRKFNTNDEQIRAEAVTQANMNAGQGTPVKMILADALAIENFIKHGPTIEIQMMRDIRDKMDEQEVRAFMGLASARENTPSAEEEHEGVVDGEPVVLRQEDVVETSGPVIVDEADGTVETADGVVRPHSVNRPKTAFDKYQEDGLTHG